MKSNHGRVIVGLLLLQQAIVGLGETLRGTTSGKIQGEAHSWHFEGATFSTEPKQSFSLGSLIDPASGESASETPAATQTISDLQLQLSLGLDETPPLSVSFQSVPSLTEDSPRQQLTLTSRAVWDNLRIGDTKYTFVLSLSTSQTTETDGASKVELVGQFLPHINVTTEIAMTVGNAVGGPDLSLIGDGTTLVRWGNLNPRNSLTIRTKANATITETPFQIAELKFRNESSSTAASATGLDFQIDFSTASEPIGRLDFPCEINATTNVGERLVDKDGFRLTQLISTETVEINGAPHWLLLWFTNPSGSALAKVNELSVVEEREDSAEVWAVLTQTNLSVDERVRSFNEQVTDTAPLDRLPNWINGATYSAGGLELLALELHDLNGDSHLDLLSVSNVGAAFAFGTGRGTFAQAPRNTLFGELQRGASGDLDGDGDRDLVLLGTEIGIWLNDGSGQFENMEHVLSEVVTDSEDTGKGDLALADLDADGDLDLVVSPRHGREIVIYENTGHGDLVMHSMLPLARRNSITLLETWLSLEDLNKDGSLDIVVARRERASAAEATVSVWIGNGQGDFSTDQEVYRTADEVDSLRFPSGLITQDINHDGQTDIVVPSLSTLPVGTSLFGRNQAAWFNKGDATFSSLPETFAGPFWRPLWFGDLNADGVTDFLSARQKPYNVTDPFSVTDPVRALFSPWDILVENGRGDGALREPSTAHYHHPDIRCRGRSQ